MANADGSVVIRVDADDKKAIKKLDDVAKKANDVRKGLDGKSILINTDVSQAYHPHCNKIHFQSTESESV